MSKVKLILLGLLATYAVSAAAPGIASAATQEFWVCQKVGTSEGRWKNSHCTERGGTEEWKTKGLAGAETKGIEGTSGESKLEVHLVGKVITIACKKDIVKGTLKPAGASAGTLRLTECKVIVEGVESTTCKMREPLEYAFTDQLIHNAKGEIEDEFKSTKAEEVFYEFTIEGSQCALKGTFKVKGKYICELPNATQSLVTHQIVCAPAGSKLTVGTEPAFFTSNEHVNMVGGPQWGAA